jgi:uncharacterized protein (TIGR02996 family)
MRDDDFLHAIAEAPEDDALRLVYADWLEDHGQAERAELIRAQCRINALAGDAGWLRDEADFCDRLPGYRGEPFWLERLSFAVGPPPCAEELTLRRRAAELVAAHGREWLGGLPLRGWFRRGLAEGICATLPELLEHAPAIRAMPTLRALSLALSGGQPPSAGNPLRLDEWEQWLSRTEVFDRIEHLYISGLPDSNDNMLDVGRLPRLRRLVCSGGDGMPYHPPGTGSIRGDLAWYEVSGWRLSVDREPGWAEEIFAQDVLAGLRGPTLDYLDYSDNNLGDEGVIALADTEHMANLRTLRLNWSEVSGTSLWVLGNSPHLPNLRHLDLSANHLPDDELAGLLLTPLLGQLRLLDLGNVPATEGLIARLVESAAAAGLRVLAVGPSSDQAANWRSGRAVRALAESPHLRGLRRLALHSVPLDDDLVLALARSRTLESLHTLELWIWPEPPDGAARRELEARYRVVWNGAPAG